MIHTIIRDGESPRAIPGGYSKSLASHNVSGARHDSNPFDGDLPHHDNISCVFWSLVIVLVFLVPVVGIALIKLFN